MTVSVEHFGSGDVLKHSREVLTNGQTGSAIYLGRGFGTVTALPSGTGKIQFTTGRPSDIEGGTAQWQDWSRGNVTSPASDITEGPVTAVRGVSVSGNFTIEVLQS